MWNFVVNLTTRHTCIQVVISFIGINVYLLNVLFTYTVYNIERYPWDLDVFEAELKQNRTKLSNHESAYMETYTLIFPR